MSTPIRVDSLFRRASSFPRTSMQLQRSLRSRVRTLETTNNHATSCVPALRRPTPCSSSRHIFSQRLRWNARSIDAPCNSANTSTSTFSEYVPPSTGVLSYLPRSWVPYAELIRLDKPTGTLYLFFPCLFSTLLAAPLTTPVTTPLMVLSTSTLFLTGALIMRGAGCTVNDLWDRNLDPKVARTRLRPIARGAISVQQAIPFLGAQLLSGLAILVCFPTQCLYYGIPSLILVGTYPLAKRVTNYPQFVLGLTFSWGAMMGFPALGIDLLSNSQTMLSAVCLYASCVAWTVVYDMIYAYQDIQYDAAAGIKSIALAQQSNAKAFLATVATLQVGLLASAGVAVGAGPVFFAGACGGAAVTLGHMILKVDLKSVQDCWAWFRKGAWIVGGVVSAGLGGEYAVKYFDLYERKTALNSSTEIT